MQTTPIASSEINIDLSGTTDAPKSNASPGAAPKLKNPYPARVQTMDDLALSHLTLDVFPEMKAWRNRLFKANGLPEICPELPTLQTEAMRRTESLGHTPKRRAEVLHHIFSKKRPQVEKNDLLPGSTTTSFVGPVVYMDTIGYCIWPELNNVSKRPQNPFLIQPETANKLNREVFPYWLNRRSVQEVARYSHYDTTHYENRDTVAGQSIDPPLKKKAGTTPKCQELMERVAFYLSDKATAVSHTVPDFDRMLQYGLRGLIEQMQMDLAGSARENSEQSAFLESVIQVFEGAITYAEHLAEEAEKNGNRKLAEICRRVPSHPATTLDEAVTAVWICYHLLLQENTNFGLSVGRLDQLLNRFYLEDWNRLDSEQEKAGYVAHAVELVGNFFLHCSDHVPLSTEGSEKLFAGSGSNQALTVGGVRVEDGQLVDAVNDMTYIVLKATELLAIRDPNVHARYHSDVHHRDAAGNKLPEGQNDPYMERICQVNLLTRATPAIHGDAPVIETMANYYAAHEGVSREEALADAADYASIGCIEQNAVGKHYGHTGSSLMVLPAVLELTLFGGKHRSDGVEPNDPCLITGTPAYTSKPLTEMASMDEFEAAFRTQLDAMAQEVVRNNNYLGRFFEKARPSPFLSGLFIGPTNLPGGKGAVFRDLTAGGAKYNSAGIAIIGLADIIDAFCVIESLVFDGNISAQELLDAMAADFDLEDPGPLGKDRLQEIIQAIRLAPKYGAGVERQGPLDNSMALENTNRLTRMIDQVFYAYRTHRGGRYLAGYWSMTNHAGFGMLTKATPNGRRSGAAFAGGITPCPGIVKKDGSPVNLLDHMLSVANVDYMAVRNGYTYNLSLTPRGPDHVAEDASFFSNHVRAFMEHNGVLVQLCVTSLEHLEKADKAATKASQEGAGDAEQEALIPFKDLMIRVAGYSAYFITLSPEMRREIIDRANFDMTSGVELHAAPIA
ncbi:MAG: formate acetyltransferase [Magnetococcales bacterium]|nr:formate acetyltransferase [Magnetococcales bacterium]